MAKNSSSNGRIWLGAALILIGLLLFMRNFHFHIFDIDIFSWPLIALIAGLFIIFYHKDSFFGWLLIVVGGIGLTSRYLGISFRSVIIDYWPVLLIILGAYTLIRAFGGSKDKAEDVIEEKDHYLDEFSVFGDKSKFIKTENFLGGKTTSLFGEMNIDLREAALQRYNTVLDSITLFGSTNIYLPADWEVVIKTVTIFGGFEDKRTKSSTEKSDKKILVIKGLVLFGGGELKN
ncbi:MAG: LiaF-related protein [Melioribacteraceae bacterium]|nr:LiaF-related protein [Melioribacteraceae bacterium]